MDLLVSIATLGGAALILIIIGTVLAAYWWRGTECEPLLLTALLRRQGEDVATRAFESSTRELGIAIRRCLACHEAAQCRAWLASGAREGYASFCPNTAYIVHVRSAA